MHDASMMFWKSRSRNTGYPMPPAQIPACGIPAPGSSVVLTFTARCVFLLSARRNSNCLFWSGARKA